MWEKIPDYRDKMLVSNGVRYIGVPLYHAVSLWSTCHTWWKANFLLCLFQLITYGDTREEALTTMAKALDNYCIKGNWCLWVCVGQCSTDCWHCMCLPSLPPPSSLSPQVSITTSQCWGTSSPSPSSYQETSTPTSSKRSTPKGSKVSGWGHTTGSAFLKFVCCFVQSFCRSCVVLWGEEWVDWCSMFHACETRRACKTVPQSGEVCVFPPLHTH